MKKLFTFLLFGLVAYTIFFDLTNGTLQMIRSDQNIPVNETMAFEWMTAERGDTVLSALEKVNGSLPVSIEEAMNDFKKLNPGVDPGNIQSGNTYKIPVYDKKPF